MVYEVWIPLQSYSCLQATPMRGICDGCYADRRQDGSKNLLFNFGRGDSLQNGPSSNLAGKCDGMPGVVTAAVTSSKFLTPPVPASCVPFCTPKQIGVVPNGLPAIDTPAFLLVTYVDQREDG